MLSFVRSGFMAALIAVLASCAPSSSLSPADQARATRLDGFLQSLETEGIIPGASVLVYHNGRQVYFGAVGEQDSAAHTPFTRATIGRIYSMTKPITGIALMMLYEEGKFDLDDPIAKYMPEYADLKVFAGTDENGAPVLEAPTRPVTIRDLMRHTAGMTYGVFGDTPVDKIYRKSGILGYDKSNAELSTGLAALPLLYQPGTRWHYSVAVDVQGRLIEVLSGQTLGDFMRTRIFEPLGMKDTGFTVPAGAQARFGALYRLTDKGMETLDDTPPFMANKPFLTDMAFESGGGGLVSTIDDYMRFALMLQNEGTLDGVRLIKPQTLALMTTDQLVGIDHGNFYKGASFGLDFMIQQDPKVGLRLPTGSFGWGGMAGTYFFVDPKDDLTVVLFDQVINSSGVHLRRRLIDTLFAPDTP